MTGGRDWRKQRRNAPGAVAIGQPGRHLTRADYHLMQTDADACAGVGHTCLIWQVSDPAYLVTRQMEDYVTWVDTSKVKRTVMKYNDKLDDFDLL